MPKSPVQFGRVRLHPVLSDKLLGERHLRRLLKEYEKYFNQARPHQGIAQQIPAGDRRGAESGPVRCRDVLGGIIHDYYRAAA